MICNLIISALKHFSNQHDGERIKEKEKEEGAVDKVRQEMKAES